MLKGVNKRVVEVVDIESEYFERAILFLKTEKPDSDEKTLKQRAGEYLRAIRYSPRRALPLGRWAFGAFKLIAAAAAGAVIATMINF